MAVWSAQSLQAVWFVNHPHATDLAEFFEAVTGLAPKSIQRNQVFGSAAATVGAAQSDDGVLSHVVQFSPGRVDLSIAPVDSSAPFMSDTEDQIDRLKRMVSDHGIDGRVTRLAFIVSLAQEVPDFVSANSLMRLQIGMDFPLDSDQDFMFRLNRRAEIGGHECNRLITWSVAQLQSMQITISLQPIMMAQPAASPPAAAKIAAFSAIDVNTAPNATGAPFSSQEQKTIFAALADETLRLCQANCLKALQ